LSRLSIRVDCAMEKTDVRASMPLWFLGLLAFVSAGGSALFCSAYLALLPERISGAFSSVLAALIVWVCGVMIYLRYRRVLSGSNAGARPCNRCRYDCRRTLERCPECGMVEPVIEADTSC
jgi:hypothetical protein